MEIGVGRLRMLELYSSKGWEDRGEKAVTPYFVAFWQRVRVKVV